MEKPIDTRNWKCLFGMHQAEIVESTKRVKYAHSTSKLPYKAWTHVVTRCVHCGKIESGDF